MRKTQIKIEPWNYDDEDNATYTNKLTAFSNFNTRENMDKARTSLQNWPTKFFSKADGSARQKFKVSANSTFHNCPRANKSELKHRVTTLTFKDECKEKSKDFSPSKRRKADVTSQKFYKKLDIQRSQQLSPLGAKRQIYYNRTQMPSPLQRLINTKNICVTEGQQITIKIPKVKLIKSDKPFENQMLLRELSLERKIFMLQSGSLTRLAEKDRIYRSGQKDKMLRVSQKDKFLSKQKAKKNQKVSHFKRVQSLEKEESQKYWEYPKQHKNMEFKQGRSQKKTSSKYRNIIDQICMVEEQYANGKRLWE